MDSTKTHVVAQDTEPVKPSTPKVSKALYWASGLLLFAGLYDLYSFRQSPLENPVPIIKPGAPFSAIGFIICFVVIIKSLFNIKKSASAKKSLIAALILLACTEIFYEILLKKYL